MVRRRGWTSPDRGGVTLEVTGLIVLAALLVSCISLAVMDDNRVGKATSAAVCRILSLGQGRCAGPGTAALDPRLPTDPCTTDGTGYTVNVRETAPDVAEGSTGSVSVEALSSGQYRVSVASGSADNTGITGSSGSSGGPGGNKLSASQADVYLVDTRDEADDIAAWATYTQTRDTVASVTGTGPSGVGWLARNVTEPFTDFAAEHLGLHRAPGADSTTYLGGVSANASTWDTLGLVAENANSDASEILGYRSNADGSTTLIGQASGSLVGAGALNAATGSVGSDAKATVEATYAAGGTLQGVSITAESVGGDTRTVSTWSLPVASAADRSAAQTVIAEPDTSNLASFFGAARDHGQMTRVSYATAGLDLSQATPAWFVQGGGIHAGYTTPQTKVTSAEYYNGDGWAPWAACRAGA